MSTRSNDNFRSVWNKLHNEFKQDKTNILNYDSWLDNYSDVIDGCQSEIIDLGCGVTGNNTLYLIQKGKKVISCDFAEEALKVIDENIPNSKTMLFDMLDGIPFKNDSVDLIIADLSLHYFKNEDTKKVISNIYNVLKEDGILLVRLNSIKTSECIKLKENGVEEIEHNLYFNKGMLKRFFSEEDIINYFNQFEIISMIEENMDRFKTNEKIVWNCKLKKTSNKYTDKKVKKTRIATRCYLFKDNKIVAIKYKNKGNRTGYYDLPGGKIEDGESAIQCAKRECYEETGLSIDELNYSGNLIIEYPDRIFDFSVFITNNFEGDFKKSEENDVELIYIEQLINLEKKFGCIKLLEKDFINNLMNCTNFKYKIEVEDNENIVSINEIE